MGQLDGPGGIRHLLRRSLLAALLLGSVAAVPAIADPPGTAAPPGCTDLTLPVALAAHRPARYHIWGELCGAAAGVTAVQLLIPGLTYNHIYWDFPYQPASYSYAAKAVAAGYATFAVDRIGTGHSSRPPATAVNFATNAFVIHEIIAALRNGTTGSPAFTKVIEVGHSVGSAVAETEAATYHDVDAVVLTADLHAQGTGLPGIFASVRPAQLEPTTSGTHSPLLYFTADPAERSLFYNPAQADPSVIAYDAAHEDTATIGELFGIGPFDLSHVGDGITVPVLLVDGSDDGVFCGVEISCASHDEVLNYARPYYTGAPTLDLIFVPGSGHDLQLQLTAPTTDTAMLSWIHTYVPAA